LLNAVVQNTQINIFYESDKKENKDHVGVSKVDRGKSKQNDLIFFSSINSNVLLIISFCCEKGGLLISKSHFSGGSVLKKSLPKLSKICVALYFKFNSSAFSLNSLS